MEFSHLVPQPTRTYREVISPYLIPLRTSLILSIFHAYVSQWVYLCDSSFFEDFGPFGTNINIKGVSLLPWRTIPSSMWSFVVINRKLTWVPANSIGKVSCRWVRDLGSNLLYTKNQLVSWLDSNSNDNGADAINSNTSSNTITIIKKKKNRELS